MNKRRRYQAKRRRSWAKAFVKLDAFMRYGEGACSRDARRAAVAYLNSHRPHGTLRQWS